jgi:hypothetical protein
MRLLEEILSARRGGVLLEEILSPGAEMPGARGLRVVDYWCGVWEEIFLDRILLLDQFFDIIFYPNSSPKP